MPNGHTGSLCWEETETKERRKTSREATATNHRQTTTAITKHSSVVTTGTTDRADR